MPARIPITPEIRRIIVRGRASTPPVPWSQIANEIGVKSWTTPINMAKRLGIYKRVLRPADAGKAAVLAAWERMAEASEATMEPNRT